MVRPCLLPLGTLLSPDGGCLLLPSPSLVYPAWCLFQTDLSEPWLPPLSRPAFSPVPVAPLSELGPSPLLLVGGWRA